MFCDKLISHPVNTDGHAPRACFFIATSSHLDTVPLGSAPWTFPPHGGEISGGRLFGRGASDMKGGISKRKVLFTDNCQFQSVLDTPKKQSKRGRFCLDDGSCTCNKRHCRSSGFVLVRIASLFDCCSEGPQSTPF
ncbi:M20/M25/M40 family metallo-hydrolase [Falsihalocynthiibacter arcticus]|uniref:M20/M25/M40 family metallo-hydrolase n=1 Tax=Falsihalocynthiibacter arcticus TaxID=1579316 RepID=UPI0009EEA179